MGAKLKLIVKLAAVWLVGAATYHVGSAYLQFYQFKDAATELAQFAGDRPVAELRRRVLDLASQYDIPLEEGALRVRRDDRHHTYIDGDYEAPIDLLPRYQYPWPFSLHIDVLTLNARSD